MVTVARQHPPVNTAPPASTLRVPAHDGINLHVEAYGHRADLPILMAHGFGQSRLAWSASAAALAVSGFYCLAADGRGHGLSSWNGNDRYEMDQFIEDARTLVAKVGGKPIWVGASMGGLIGMIAEAETAGGLFEALVLVDVTPRWETQGVERILDFMRAHPQGFASVDEARDAVLHYLPHRAERASSDRLAKMLVTMPNGRLRWHWDPRLLNEVGERGEEYLGRLHSAAGQLRLPVLLISGDKSDVVSTTTIDEFLKLVPHAEHQRIADATHMVVGDDNHTFTQSVSTFIHRLAVPKNPQSRSAPC
jgi:pimeloyl-ACP methyl ester carboxylesterase